MSKLDTAQGMQQHPGSGQRAAGAGQGGPRRPRQARRPGGPGQRPGVIGASPVNGPFDIKRLCLRGQVQQTRAQYWQEAQAAHQAARAVNHFTRSQERA